MSRHGRILLGTVIATGAIHALMLAKGFGWI